MGVMVRDTHTHTHFTLVPKYLNKATLKWLLPRETRWLLLTPASQWALRLSLDKDACISVVHAGAGTSTCAGGRPLWLGKPPTSRDTPRGLLEGKQRARRGTAAATKGVPWTTTPLGRTARLTCR